MSCIRHDIDNVKELCAKIFYTRVKFCFSDSAAEFQFLRALLEKIINKNGKLIDQV